MKIKLISRMALQLALVLGTQLYVIATPYAQATAESSTIPKESSTIRDEESSTIQEERSTIQEEPSATISQEMPATTGEMTGSAGTMESMPADSAPPLPEMSVPAAMVDEASNAATAAEASTAEAHTGYGLEELWAQGDLVARGTLIIMMIMSAATWYVLVTKLIQQQVLLGQAKATGRFWKGNNILESMGTYKEHSAFRSVAQDGVTAVEQHHKRQGEKIELSEWLGSQLQRSVERVIAQLQNGLSLLATVGSCSPFVGLFGTVWGIYNALIAIGLSGQASIDKVAGPVGEALIMTAIGLAVAVPAVLGYNWLVRRNKVIVDGLRNFAADIHANLTMGVKGG